jgi:hypothetical protein
MTKERLQILTAFTLMSRLAVDRLRFEHYGPFMRGTTPERLRADLDKIVSQGLPEALKEKDEELFTGMSRLAGCLVEQLMLSQYIMAYRYQSQNANFVYSHLLSESCDRAEAIVKILLDHAMTLTLGARVIDLLG